MIKSIIVEDDPGYSRNLKKILSTVSAAVEVLAICDCVDDALDSIKKLKPEIVFLDIELGSEVGFEILERVGTIDFDVIFTTNHINKYINEIRACALSYLPKPYDIDEINVALQKYQDKKQSKVGLDQLKILLSNLHTQSIEQKVIWISDETDSYAIKTSDIVYCCSDNQYTTFFILADKKYESEHVYSKVFATDESQKGLLKFKSSRGLGAWESDLVQFNFCRIHNEYLVNLKHVVRYSRGEGGAIKLSTGLTLSVSKGKKANFQRLSGLK